LFGGMGFSVLATSGLLSSEAMPFLSIGFLVLVMGGTVATSLWLSGRKRKARMASAGVTPVACPSCGAPNELHAGQTLETCRFCRAALVPSGTIMQRALSRVDEAAGAAELARFRAERRGMSALMSRGAHRYTPYIIVGSFLPMTLGAAVIAAAQVVFDPESANLRAVAALFVLGSLNAGILVLIYARRSAIQARWQKVADDLAYQFGGRRVTTGLAGVVDWLNAFWAAPYEVNFLSTSAYQVSLVLDACGYAVLVDIEPSGAHAQHYPARLHVLLAAAVPDAAVTRPSALPHAAQAAHAWLGAAGFDVRLTRAGLLAIARPATLATLRRAPERAHLLSTVVTTLAGLARGAGAAPVSPMP